MTNKHIIAPPTKKVVLFLTFPFNNALTNKYNKVTGNINEIFCKVHATTPFIKSFAPCLESAYLCINFSIISIPPFLPSILRR